jgi:type IX secretion system PorP/SprF family membrane protein
MKLRKLLLFVFFSVSGSFAVWAQDVHFTQYNESPMTLNPANTGFYKNQYRFNCNFRNQWNYQFVNNNNLGVTGTGFETAAGSFDMCVSINKSSPDKLGIGVQVFNDRAGEVSLSTTGGAVGVSYWKNIQHFRSKYIVIGFTAGFINKYIDYTNLQLPDQYNHLDPLKPLSAISYPVNENIMYTDLSLGVKYFNAISKRKFVQYGIAFLHLNKPKNSFFFDAAPDRIYRKINLHGGIKLPVAAKIDFMPSGLISIQGPSFEINQGAFFRFQITENRSKDLMAYNIGLWFRESRAYGSAFLFDAVNIVSKLEFNQYTIGLSYDVNVSALASTTKLRGGPELSFSYTGLLEASLGNHKRPICPAF